MVHRFRCVPCETDAFDLSKKSIKPNRLPLIYNDEGVGQFGYHLVSKNGREGE